MWEACLAPAHRTPPAGATDRSPGSFFPSEPGPPSFPSSPRNLTRLLLLACPQQNLQSPLFIHNPDPSPFPIQLLPCYLNCCSLLVDRAILVASSDSITGAALSVQTRPPFPSSLSRNINRLASFVISPTAETPLFGFPLPASPSLRFLNSTPPPCALSNCQWSAERDKGKTSLAASRLVLRRTTNPRYIKRPTPF